MTACDTDCHIYACGMPKTSYALLTRFERRQREQTFIVLTLPLTFARTWRIFGFQTLAVFLFECDTL